MNTLLNLMLSNALVAAILFAILMLLRRWIKNPAMLHLCLLLILVKLITPAYWQPEFTLFTSEFQKATVAERQIRPEEATESAEAEQTIPPVHPKTVPASDKMNDRLPGKQVPAQETLSQFLSSIPPYEETASKSAWQVEIFAEPLTGAELTTRVCTLIWLTGTTAWFLLAIWRIIRFQKYLRQALPASLELNETAKTLAQRIGLKSVPQIEMVSGNVSPLLWACFSRARIILPSRLLEQLNDAEIETLLLHELAHYRRRDHLVRLLELLTTGVYWWNPMLWWVRREIRIAEEACCDAWVVETLPEKRRSYAEVLVKAIGFVSHPQRVMGATGIGSQDVLEQRLKRIMCDSLNRNVSHWMKFVTVVIAIVLLPFAPMLGQSAPRTPTVVDKQTLPTVEEILAGYRANFKKLMPVEMTYRVLTQDNMNCINEDRRQLKGLEMILKLDRVELSNAIKQIREQILENDDYFRMITLDFVEKSRRLKENLTPEAIKTRLSESVAEHRYLWTDGKSFHYRWSTDAKNPEAELNRGPVWPAENLNTHYHSIKMISWSNKNQPPMRHWYGNGPDNRFTRAKIGNKLSDIYSFKTIAPLGLKEFKWNENYLSGLDYAMSRSTDHYQMIGRVEYQGRPVILIDGFFAPVNKETGLRNRIRAWIDPAQGYLPLRLESALVDDVNKVVRGLHHETEVLEVKKVADGYYPVRIKYQEYTFDSLGIEKQIKEIGVENLEDRPLPELPLVPGHVKIWEATEFTPRKAIEPATLTLEFPKGTIYENEIDGNKYHAGEPQPIPPSPEYAPKLQVGEIAPTLEVARWLDGKTRNLDDFRGKVVVLLFMDISAFSNIQDEMRPQLRMMMDWLKQIQQKYAAQGVVFIDIHPVGTTPDQINAYQNFRQSKSLAAIDSGTNLKVGTTLKKYSDPGEMNAFLIGRDGRIVMSTDSAVDHHFENYYYYAATKLKIPLEFQENLSEEEAMHQSMRILEFIVREQIDNALEGKKPSLLIPEK
ncbi:Methicillin resistance mecR1 protein [Gimesia alba]|uniref:Methicillin resistance mecR1 protein n=1 Tax=Gimesia alba TaxID=2527973 RepID=A0A517RII8_9PLAN|nr:M56 family metallopeptidase [Gimesia alba]QDT43696.1 Methicillin resistance mecR1 protein [Gimesia alba]